MNDENEPDQSEPPVTHEDTEEKDRPVKRNPPGKMFFQRGVEVQK